MSAESGPDQPLRSQPAAPDVTIGFHTITLVIKVRAVQRPTVAAFVCGNTPSLKPRRMINCRGHTPMNLSTRPGSTTHDKITHGTTTLITRMRGSLFVRGTVHKRRSKALKIDRRIKSATATKDISTSKSRSSEIVPGSSLPSGAKRGAMSSFDTAATRSKPKPK